jgi:chromosomal replication initiation ATPase DnaA
MIKNWEIKPEPTSRDRDRHRLFIDGNAGDLLSVLKTLGGMCGRPQKETSPYSNSVPLLKADERKIRKAEILLSRLSGKKTKRKIIKKAKPIEEPVVSKVKLKTKPKVSLPEKEEPPKKSEKNIESTLKPKQKVEIKSVSEKEEPPKIAQKKPKEQEKVDDFDWGLGEEKPEIGDVEEKAIERPFKEEPIKEEPEIPEESESIDTLTPSREPEEKIEEEELSEERETENLIDKPRREHPLPEKDDIEDEPKLEDKPDFAQPKSEEREQDEKSTEDLDNVPEPEQSDIEPEKPADVEDVFGEPLPESKDEKPDETDDLASDDIEKEPVSEDSPVEQVETKDDKVSPETDFPEQSEIPEKPEEEKSQEPEILEEPDQPKEETYRELPDPFAELNEFKDFDETEEEPKLDKEDFEAFERKYKVEGDELAPPHPEDAEKSDEKPKLDKEEKKTTEPPVEREGKADDEKSFLNSVLSAPVGEIPQKAKKDESNDDEILKDKDILKDETDMLSPEMKEDENIDSDDEDLIEDIDSKEGEAVAPQILTGYFPPEPQQKSIEEALLDYSKEQQEKAMQKALSERPETPEDIQDEAPGEGSFFGVTKDLEEELAKLEEELASEKPKKTTKKNETKKAEPEEQDESSADKEEGETSKSGKAKQSEVANAPEETVKPDEKETEGEEEEYRVEIPFEQAEQENIRPLEEDRHSPIKTIRTEVNISEDGAKQKKKWSIEVPLIPVYNFETLVTGTNRFAHAAGRSVIDSPGSMYNPLVLFGPAGSGKTHFLHAIGYGLSNVLGQGNVFVSDGVRFSRGIQRLIKDNKIASVDSMMENVQTILIDDIHLVAVSSANREYMSKWLNSFVKKKKQVVVTSVYPPKNLSKLESNLNFPLNQGWVVELKNPRGNSYDEIVDRMISGFQLPFSLDDSKVFFSHSNFDLNTIYRNFVRFKTFEKLSAEAELVFKPNDLMNMILGNHEDEVTPAPSPQEIQDALKKTLPVKKEWGRWGFFCPAGSKEYVGWIVKALMDKAEELKIPGGFEAAFKYEYDPSSLVLSAFKITDLCNKEDITGAIVLGPKKESVEDKGQKDFFDVTRHMLETLHIKCGFIKHTKLKSSSAFLRLLLDLIK